jgi:hypothetical protein
MSTNNYRQVSMAMTIIIALTTLFVLTSVSFAAGGQDTKHPTVCVSGYVINHREQPVDGTRFQHPLRIHAYAMRAGNDLVPLPNLEAEVQTLDALEMLSAQALDVNAEVNIDGRLHGAVATVGSDGSYQFPKLRAGYYYQFALPLPADWDGIVPEAGRGKIAWTSWTKLDEQGTKCYDVLFKIRRWFDVTVWKWEEQRDGSVQPGKDWTMTAIPQGDLWAIEQTGKTDAKGGVVLPLTPGKWLIQETVKSGWTPITPASVTITLDQYAPSGHKAAPYMVTFKNLEPVCYATITVQKHGLGTDADDNQVWLGPLAGWKINLSRPDGAMTPITLTTDGSGKVVFKDLKPGVYNVQETVQPGWVAVSPNPQQVIIRDCEKAEVKFKNLEVVGKLQISGTKYFRAWVPPYQGKTVGLSGWGITATLKGTTNPTVFVTTTTDALGRYMFSQATLDAAGMAIPGATITVCEEERFHWIPVTPVCVDVRFPYPVPVTYNGAVVNFTNVQDPPLDEPVGASYSSGSSTATCSLTYTVRPGDNLSRIAAANGTTVSALTQLNGLSNPNMIRAGQTLCIQ